MLQTYNKINHTINSDVHYTASLCSFLGSVLCWNMNLINKYYITKSFHILLYCTGCFSGADTKYWLQIEIIFHGNKLSQSFLSSSYMYNFRHICFITPQPVFFLSWKLKYKLKLWDKLNISSNGPKNNKKYGNRPKKKF